MHIDDCFYLGYTQKTIGHKGELALKLDVDSPSSYANLDAFFVQNHKGDQVLVPYFVEHSQIQGQILRCKIEGIDQQKEAKAIIGKSIFLPISALPELSGNQFYFHEVIDYQIKDSAFGIVGTIETILEFSTTNLFSVKHQDKEILIPINDEIINRVDRENQCIEVSCPDGLIDLYLEE